MKYILSLLILFCGLTAFAQRYVLPEGEFMDTTRSAVDTSCRDYNMYYYSARGKYPKNSASLLKEVRSYLQKTAMAYSGSGYVTFRFIVDCNGHPMKRTEVLQTDEHYKSYHFEKRMVNELYDFVKTLDKWRTAKTEEGQSFPYHAVLTFKIRDGKVITIIP